MRNSVICIRGFVVNIRDPLTYDIGVRFSEQLQNKYRDVLSGIYTYETEINGEPIEGLAYKCVLYGIAGSGGTGTKTSPRIMHTLNKIMLLSNGWCDLKIHGIIGESMVVTIIDPLTENTYNAQVLQYLDTYRAVT